MASSSQIPARARLSSSGPHVSQSEYLILPDAPSSIDNAADELLHELLHHHHEDTLVDVDDEDIEVAITRRLPWWKRPSPWWWVIIYPRNSNQLS